MVATTLASPEEHRIDAAARQLAQTGYSTDRLKFVATDEAELVARLSSAHDEFAAATAQLLGLLRSGRTADAQRLQAAQLNPLADRLERLTNELVHRAEAEIVESIEGSRQASTRSQLLVVAFAGTSLALAVVLGLALAFSITNPLRVLENHVERIARGDFSGQVQIENRDELGALAANIDRMKDQLGQLYTQLEIASRHKSEFLANMSHELRTPLNAVIGYSEMLQEQVADLGQTELVPDLRKINTAGRYLLDLINDILDLSKVEAGKMEVFLETFEVAPLVEEVAAVIQPLVARKANVLTVQCTPDIDRIHADKIKVRQVLFNLLSNAAKFTERGRVALEVERIGADVHFVVIDTGIGMTTEQMQNLFQAFSQVSAETSRKYGGTGLGLALAQRFCRLMGGEITVTSVAGRGSRFDVRLPAQVARVEPAVAAPVAVDEREAV